MERQLWGAILQAVKQIRKPPYDPRQTYPALVILKVWMWAVLHDRPVSWACEAANWPCHERHWKRPSNATMSRRLRCPGFRSWLACIERKVLRSEDSTGLVWMIDGKPLSISGCTKDRQAGYGRAASGKAKGYKLHAIVGANGQVICWRIAPMNKDERLMAQRMLKTTQVCGYLVGDGNYDSNKLHAICDQHGNLQFVTPRRYGPQAGTGHRQQTAGRLRSKALLENPHHEFGDSLMRQRNDIERFYAQLTNWGGSLTHLPPWARTHRRVHRWVQAKLILNALKPRCHSQTCVN